MMDEHKQRTIAAVVAKTNCAIADAEAAYQVLYDTVFAQFKKNFLAAVVELVNNNKL